VAQKWKYVAQKWKGCSLELARTDAIVASEIIESFRNAMKQNMDSCHTGSQKGREEGKNARISAKGPGAEQAGKIRIYKG
jgi:hypothetical protein